MVQPPWKEKPRLSGSATFVEVQKLAVAVNHDGVQQRRCSQVCDRSHEVVSLSQVVVFSLWNLNQLGSDVLTDSRFLRWERKESLPV